MFIHFIYFSLHTVSFWHTTHTQTQTPLKHLWLWLSALFGRLLARLLSSLYVTIWNDTRLSNKHVATSHTHKPKETQRDIHIYSLTHTQYSPFNVFKCKLNYRQDQIYWTLTHTVSNLGLCVFCCSCFIWIWFGLDFVFCIQTHFQWSSSSSPSSLKMACSRFWYSTFENNVLAWYAPLEPHTIQWAY